MKSSYKYDKLNVETQRKKSLTMCLVSFLYLLIIFYINITKLDLIPPSSKFQRSLGCEAKEHCSLNHYLVSSFFNHSFLHGFLLFLHLTTSMSTLHEWYFIPFLSVLLEKYKVEAINSNFS